MHKSKLKTVDQQLRNVPRLLSSFVTLFFLILLHYATYSSLSVFDLLFNKSHQLSDVQECKETKKNLKMFPVAPLSFLAHVFY